MKDLFHKISEGMVLEILFIGVVLLVGLRLAQKGLGIYTRRTQGDCRVTRFFPLTECAVWVAYLTWGATQIFQTGVAGSIVLLVLMAGLFIGAAHFVVRDWIAGAVFKAEDKYRLRDIISFKGTRGQLKSLGYRSLTLETADGSAVEIPYRTLAKEQTIEKFPRKTACSTFKLAMPAHETFADVQQRLQTIALCAPWCSLVRPPQIRLLDTQDDRYLVEVVTYMVDQRYAVDVEAYIKHHVTS